MSSADAVEREILHSAASGCDIGLQRCAAAVGLMNGQDAILWPGCHAGGQAAWSWGALCKEKKPGLEPGLVNSISPLSPSGCLAMAGTPTLFLPTQPTAWHGKGVGPEEAAVKRLVPRGLSLQKYHPWLVINHCVLQ